MAFPPALLPHSIPGAGHARQWPQTVQREGGLGRGPCTAQGQGPSCRAQEDNQDLSCRGGKDSPARSPGRSEPLGAELCC